jgi:hypothetical protein
VTKREKNVDPDVFESLCRIDDLIDHHDLPEDYREELVFQRDVLIADYPETAKFRKMTIQDFMRKK